MTLGEMTPGELLDSARRQMSDTAKLIEEVVPTDKQLVITATLTSARCALVVLEDKLSKGETL
jgi:hypothetical protein